MCALCNDGTQSKCIRTSLLMKQFHCIEKTTWWHTTILMQGWGYLYICRRTISLLCVFSTDRVRNAMMMGPNSVNLSVFCLLQESNNLKSLWCTSYQSLWYFAYITRKSKHIQFQKCNYLFGTIKLEWEFI